MRSAGIRSGGGLFLPRESRREHLEDTMRIIRSFIPRLSLLLAFGFPGHLFAADKELKSVGLTVEDLGNPFYVQIAHGVSDQAKTYNPNVKVIPVSSNYDVKNQASQIKDFIFSGVDMIILGAANSKAIAPSVKQAKARGIVVVAVDVGAAGGVDATVMSDNKQAGEQAGQYIVDKLHGKGQVMIVNGHPVTSVQDRVAGALSVFKKYSDIKILSQNLNAQGTSDGGERVMSDLLVSFRHVDAVFAINDPTAIGCDLAARKAGRTDFFIVGVDGSPQGVEALKQKDSLFEATSAQDPYSMAQKAVEAGYQVLQGKKLDQDVILIPVKLITRDNVNEYTGWTR
jgi:ribose transport system substrate-binding protein